MEAGNENMKFETGPFSFYGVRALGGSTPGETNTENTTYIANNKYSFHPA